MGSREYYWAWGHPNAQVDDHMAMQGGGFARVYKREELDGKVRFCLIPQKEKITILQWTGYFPLGVPPHRRIGL